MAPACYVANAAAALQGTRVACRLSRRGAAGFQRTAHALPGAHREHREAAWQTRRWRAARTGAQAARVRRHGLRDGGDRGLARLRAARGAQHRAERAQRLLLRRAQLASLSSG